MKSGILNFKFAMKSFQLPIPFEFSFDLSLQFLKRSPQELLHRVGEDHVTKLVRLDNEDILFELRQGKASHLKITILNGRDTPAIRKALKSFIAEWFDLKTDLNPFYALAAKDRLLKDLVIQHFGYRIIGQPDLFESLVWAVLGQQINVQFAFTLKSRFVQHFGEKLLVNEQDYYLFPKPETVAVLNDDQLLPLQFSRQKSKYVVLIAEAFASGEVSKEKLKGLTLQEAKEKLMTIKGIGNWTANYALMKTFRYPDAFPLEDAGIHNAIRNLRKMDRKPTLDEVKRIFKKYKGWEAYATLYLWKSL
jgi:DNA-3-methyladenine glycosylase II